MGDLEVKTLIKKRQKIGAGALNALVAEAELKPLPTSKVKQLDHLLEQKEEKEAFLLKEKELDGNIEQACSTAKNQLTKKAESTELSALKEEIAQKNSVLHAKIEQSLESSNENNAKKVHVHEISDIDGLKKSIDSKLDNATFLSEASKKENVLHGHTLENLQAISKALQSKASKSAIQEKTNKVHNHSLNEINALQQITQNKAEFGHKHPCAQIKSLGNATKRNVGKYNGCVVLWDDIKHVIYYLKFFMHYAPKYPKHVKSARWRNLMIKLHGKKILSSKGNFKFD